MGCGFAAILRRCWPGGRTLQAEDYKRGNDEGPGCGGSRSARAWSLLGDGPTQPHSHTLPFSAASALTVAGEGHGHGPWAHSISTPSPVEDLQARRGALVNEENPCAVALIAMESARVLSQSPASLKYYQSVPASQGLSTERLELDEQHPLAKLFSLCAPELADEMMANVQAGHVWRCVLDVPMGMMLGSLQPLETAAAAAATAMTAAVAPAALQQMSEQQRQTMHKASHKASASTPGGTVKSGASVQLLTTVGVKDDDLSNASLSSPEAEPVSPLRMPQTALQLSTQAKAAEEDAMCAQDGGLTSGDFARDRDKPSGMPRLRSISRRRLSTILNFRNSRGGGACEGGSNSSPRLQGTASFKRVHTSSALVNPSANSDSLPLGLLRTHTASLVSPGTANDSAEASHRLAVTYANNAFTRGSSDVCDAAARPFKARHPDNRGMLEKANTAAASSPHSQPQCTSPLSPGRVPGQRRVSIVMPSPLAMPGLPRVGEHSRPTSDSPQSQDPGTASTEPVGLIAAFAKTDDSLSCVRAGEGQQLREQVSSFGGSSETGATDSRLVKLAHDVRIEVESPRASHQELKLSRSSPVAPAPATRQLRISIPSPNYSSQEQFGVQGQGLEHTSSMPPHACPSPNLSCSVLARDVSVAQSRSLLAHTALNHGSWLPSTNCVDNNSTKDSQATATESSRVRDSGPAPNPLQQQQRSNSRNSTQLWMQDSSVRVRSFSAVATQQEGQQEAGPLWPAANMEAGSQDGSQGPTSGLCFHEITAKPTVDPVTKRPAFLLIQVDVTAQKQLEASLAELARAQLTILSESYPRHIIEFFSQRGRENNPQSSKHMGDLARLHESVTVLFMDIVDFTAMSKEVAPQDVINLLNSLFNRFDALCDIHGTQKVDTAGDSYIVAAGVLDVDNEGFYQAARGHLNNSVENAHRVMAFAQDMMLCAREVRMPHNGQRVEVRIGVHTGPCVSGLVGTKMSKFSLFGDTMNTASRMESTCKPGLLQVSAATRALLDQPVPGWAPGSTPTYQWQATGGVVVKGKGLMETYLWVPPRGWAQAQLHEDHAEALQQLLGALGGSGSPVSGCSSRRRSLAGLDRAATMTSQLSSKRSSMERAPTERVKRKGAASEQLLKVVSQSTDHRPKVQLLSPRTVARALSLQYGIGFKGEPAAAPAVPKTGISRPDGLPKRVGFHGNVEEFRSSRAPRRGSTGETKLAAEASRGGRRPAVTASMSTGRLIPTTACTLVPASSHPVPLASFPAALGGLSRPSASDRRSSPLPNLQEAIPAPGSGSGHVSWIQNPTQWPPPTSLMSASQSAFPRLSSRDAYSGRSSLALSAAVALAAAGAGYYPESQRSSAGTVLQQALRGSHQQRITAQHSSSSNARMSATGSTPVSTGANSYVRASGASAAAMAAAQARRSAAGYLSMPSASARPSAAGNSSGNAAALTEQVLLAVRCLAQSRSMQYSAGIRSSIAGSYPSCSASRKSSACGFHDAESLSSPSAAQAASIPPQQPAELVPGLWPPTAAMAGGSSNTMQGTGQYGDSTIASSGAGCNRSELSPLGGGGSLQHGCPRTGSFGRDQGIGDIQDLRGSLGSPRGMRASSMQRQLLNNASYRSSRAGAGAVMGPITGQTDSISMSIFLMTRSQDSNNAGASGGHGPSAAQVAQASLQRHASDENVLSAGLGSAAVLGIADRQSWEGVDHWSGESSGESTADAD